MRKLAFFISEKVGRFAEASGCGQKVEADSRVVERWWSSSCTQAWSADPRLDVEHEAATPEDFRLLLARSNSCFDLAFFDCQNEIQNPAA